MPVSDIPSGRIKVICGIRDVARFRAGYSPPKFIFNSPPRSPSRAFPTRLTSPVQIPAMGRRKIEIQPITHERNRSVTFLKRKNGLFKKAYELGVLCSVDVAVIIFDEKPGQHQKLYEYSSMDVRDIVKRHVRFTGEKDSKGPHDFSGGAKADEGEEEEEEEDDDAVAKPPAKRKASGKVKPVNEVSSPIDLDLDTTDGPMKIPTPPLRGDIRNLTLDANTSSFINMASISRMRSHLSPRRSPSPSPLDSSSSSRQHPALRDGIVRIPGAGSRSSSRAEFDFHRNFHHLGAGVHGFPPPPPPLHSHHHQQPSSMNPYGFSFIPTPTSPVSSSTAGGAYGTPSSLDLMTASGGSGTSLPPLGMTADADTTFDARLLYQQMMLRQQQQQRLQQFHQHHSLSHSHSHASSHLGSSGTGVGAGSGQGSQQQISDLAAFLDALDPPRGAGAGSSARSNVAGSGGDLGLRLDWPVHSQGQGHSQGLSNTSIPTPTSTSLSGGGGPSSSSDPSWLDFLSGTTSTSTSASARIDGTSFSWERSGANIDFDLAEVFGSVASGGGGGVGGTAGGGAGTDNTSRPRKRPRINVDIDGEGDVDGDVAIDVDPSSRAAPPSPASPRSEAEAAGGGGGDSGSEYEPERSAHTGGGGGGGRNKTKTKVKSKVKGKVSGAGGTGGKVKEKEKEKEKEKGRVRAKGSNTSMAVSAGGGDR